MIAHARFAQISPLRFLALLLALTFAAEVGIMVLLPVILPAHTSEWTEACIDALLLVLLLAPTLWWLTIQPLQDVNVSGQGELLRLRKAVEASGEVVFLTDSDGTIRFVNPAFTKLYGYDAEEVVGLTTPRILESGKMPSAFYEGFWKALLAKESVTKEFINRTKDGRLIPVSASANAIVDDKGEIVGFLAIQRDITTEKQAAKELSEAEARYRAVVEQSLAGVGVFLGDRLVYANPRLGEMLDRSPSDASELLSALEFVVEDDRKRVAQVLKETLLTTSETCVDFRVKRRDGRVSELVARAKHAVFEGQPAIFAVVLDLTEQHQIEAQFRQAQKMEIVGQLAGGIAHDFNNLLTAILGYSELILGDLPTDSNLRPDLAEVHLAAERAALLTKRLLAFSRKQRLRPAVLDLNEVVGGIEGMLRPLISENVRLVIRLAPHLNLVKVDGGQVEQVITNLVANARDAMPEGGTITIETSDVLVSEAFQGARRDVVPGEYVQLAITDTGTGMTTETLDHLFEPFFTTKEIGKGTGLGLASVYGIVEQSGGHVLVESQLGHGSTFKVLFPQTGERLESSGVPEEGGIPAGGSETILLVEDEAGVRHLARDVLTKYGYTVLEAADGEDAIMQSDGFPGAIDLLITDVVMPKLSGPTTAARLRECRPTIRVLFMSGYAASKITMEADTPFLSKPFRPGDLARSVRTVLDARNETTYATA